MYLLASLESFARGERHSGMMEPIAAGLSLEAMHEVSRYYASLPEPLPSSPPQGATAAIARGRAIASRGVPPQRVPACVACHGPGVSRRNPVYPELSGQYADYLVLQLELFKKARRGGSAYAHIMRAVAARLTSEQMRDVALYYASLPTTP
jgi:cytochrome c553